MGNSSAGEHKQLLNNDQQASTDKYETSINYSRTRQSKTRHRRKPRPSATTTEKVDISAQQPSILVFIRICVILILGVSYAMNAVSICISISNKEQSGNWYTIIYIGSSVCLAISCFIWIIIMIFGMEQKLFIAITSLLCIIPIFARLIPFWLDTTLHFELLFVLESVYFMIFIWRFRNNNNLKQLFNMLLLYTVIFVSAIISMLESMPIQNDINSYLLSSYLSICVGTSVLTLIHICLSSKWYIESGLFFKLLIAACFIYYFVIQITDKIMFDQYNDKYRIYCYYISFIAICTLFFAELFVQGPRQILLREIPDDMSITQLATFSPKQDVFSIEHENDDINYNSNPNTKQKSVVQIFPDFKPTKENRNKYFTQIKKIKNRKKINQNAQDWNPLKGSIAAIVPFYNEKAHEIHATLRSLYNNFEYIKNMDSDYKMTHFNVLLVGDGWFKADISTKKYLAQLYNGSTQFDDEFMNFKQKKNEHNTVILQTKNNKKLCINPFKNDQKKLYLKVTTIIKIDNRKKANSHEWFLGRYGFAEWCKCDYMFFTDAYSTLNKEGLYKMVMHMEQPQNKDVVCCTGRARVYTIEQELELQNLLREEHNDNDEDNEDFQILIEKSENSNSNDISGDTKRNEDEEENKYNIIEMRKNKKWWDNDIFQSDNQKREDIMADNNGNNGKETFYKIQDIEVDHRLSMNANLRACQMFEFEALYGTIGCYLLGSFLPVIPGPCGFYRSSYLINDNIRGWYFDIINKKNDPNNMDLVLGNMKLAEDRILTISSILNNDESVRHTLIPECVFYFDPMPSLTQLMKQRRRWINGSIATVIFVLRKTSFSQWNVNIFRTYYVLIMWYMQLFMYFVVAISPPLLFAIAFIFGLGNILNALINEDLSDWNRKERKINSWSYTLLVFTWLIYLLFIYYVQGGGKTRLDKYIKKKTIIQIQLILSFIFGIFTVIGTILSYIAIIRDRESILSPSKWESSFLYIVILIQCIFFAQSFILAPIFSKDIQTLIILLKTFFVYFLYAPFYVTFFFINAIANIHDLSWGTRPDNDESTNNPKSSTIKLLIIIIGINIIIGILILPITNDIYAHIAFFTIFALPSIYQIFFSIVWLIKERLFKDLWYLCKPRKLKDEYKYEYIRKTISHN